MFGGKPIRTRSLPGDAMAFPATPSLSLAGLLLVLSTVYWGAVVCVDSCGLLPWGPGLEDRLDDWE